MDGSAMLLACSSLGPIARARVRSWMNCRELDELRLYSVPMDELSLPDQQNLRQILFTENSLHLDPGGGSAPASDLMSEPYLPLWNRYHINH